MAWRNCKASLTLIDEVNHRWPNRDKSSDGTIGDAAHQSRTSDHNPWVILNGVGIVRARDIDEDLDGNKADTGADASVLFNHLLALAKAGDPRLNNGGYLIYEAKIYSIKQNWAPRPYSGTANMHRHHIHISFSLDEAGYDSTAPWGIWPINEPTPSKPQPVPKPIPQPQEGRLFMHLTEDEEKEILANSREARLRLIRIQQILEGDNTKLGDAEQRELLSLKRLEQKVGALVEAHSGAS